MNIVNKKESLVSFLGDLCVLALSLWVTLLIRHFQFPTFEVFVNHLVLFAPLFVLWLVIFYIAGLYDRLNMTARHHLPKLLFNTQGINVILAVIFFYFSPFLLLTPKIILFIYLFISLGLLLVWRIFVRPRFYFS